MHFPIWTGLAVSRKSCQGECNIRVRFLDDEVVEAKLKTGRRYFSTCACVWGSGLNFAPWSDHEKHATRSPRLNAPIATRPVIPSTSPCRRHIVWSPGRRF